MSELRTQRINNGSSNPRNIFLYDTGNSAFGINADGTGTPDLFLDVVNGRVGINTGTPAQALDVDGNLNLSGNAVIGGTLNVTGAIDFGADINADGEFLTIGGIQVTSNLTPTSGSGVEIFLEGGGASGKVQVINRGTNQQLNLNLEGDEVRLRTANVTRVTVTDTSTTVDGNLRVNGIIGVRDDDSGLDYNQIQQTLELKINNTTIAECNTAQFVPGDDGTIDLGSTGRRWEEVFSVESAINTSDATEKQSIETLEDKEIKVAKKLKGLIRKFQRVSAIKKKGDEARIHVGIIAQDLKAAFESEGLVAERYSMFCSDTWEEDGVSKTRLGVRYGELFAFIIAAL